MGRATCLSSRGKLTRDGLPHNGGMSTEEKAAMYDKVLALVFDRIALEQHLRRSGREREIVAIRADGFGYVVNLMVGNDALPGLPSLT